MIEEMAMTFHPVATSAGLFGCGAIGVRFAGKKRGETDNNRGRGGEVLQPEDTYTRHPNHLVTIASTHFIARIRTFNTKVSQEDQRMINVKLHHGGANAPCETCT